MEMQGFLGKSFSCDYCGREHKVDVRSIEYGEMEELGGFIAKLSGRGKKVFILADNITWEAAGKTIQDVLCARFETTSCILRPVGEKRVTAREEYLGEIKRKAEGSDIILTVGTGTVSDLGKITGEVMGIPVACFPTAPSMNGYTSPVAAFIKGGLKLTLPVNQASGVFCNMDVLRNSPLELIKSGFADSLAKAFANGDWKISSLVTGENFCPLPYRIVSRSEKKYMDRGDQLAMKDPSVIRALMDALNLGGISMAIAGKSSPASGGEHMISHFLDMYAHAYRDEVFAYHGIQVGTGILVSSMLYSELRGLSRKQIEKMVEKTKIDYDGKLRELLQLFPSASDLIKEEFEKKMKLARLLRNLLPEKWEQIKEEAFAVAYPPEKMTDVFRKAGVPGSFREIGVDEKTACNAICLARFIRGRLTVLDIAGEAGILEEFAQGHKG